MFRKINAKERVVGFYSTGPQIRPNDLRIHDIVQKFVPASTTVPPVFCIIDVRPDRPDLPVTAYKVTETVSTKSGQRTLSRNFAHVPSQTGAQEAEEIGVEHLLRDINDPTISTVASLIKGKLTGLDTLAEKLVECQVYLQNTNQANPEIVANLQTILNLLPNLSSDLIQSLLVKTNDMYMAMYIASIIRAVIALHDLVQNKIRYGQDGLEDQEEKKEEKKEAEKKSEEKKDKSIKN